jgi:general secretion pathway protein N
MQRLRWPGWLAFLVLTLVCLVVRTPASLLAKLLPERPGIRLALADAQGTLWNGRAQLTLNGDVLVDHLQWAWQPAALLKGQLGIVLGADAGHARVGITPSRILVEDADLSLPVAPLARLDPRIAPYGLGGRLRIATPTLTLGTPPAGQLSVDWQGAASTLVPGLPSLGDYRLNLQPQGETWVLQASTLGGALQVSGQGRWRAAEGLDASVTLQAAPGSENVVGPLLLRVGPGAPNAPRSFKFNFR